MKDYLTAENTRNQKGHRVFIRFFKRCFGQQCDVLIAHHLTCRLGSQTLEVPSADTLWFDHELMYRVFGEETPNIIQVLAGNKAAHRDETVSRFLDALDAKDPEGRVIFERGLA